MSDVGKTDYYNKIIKEFDPSYGLKQDQFVGFSLLSGMLAKQFQLNDAEKKIVARFLDQMINDPASNDLVNIAVEKMLQRKYDNDLVTTADLVLELSFRTRNLDEFNKIYDAILPGLDEMIEKIQKGSEIDENMKISSRDYAVLRNVSGLMPIINQLKPFDLPDVSFLSLEQKVSKCQDIVSNVEQKIKTNMHAQHRLFGSYLKQNSAHERAMSFYKNLTDLLVKKQISSDQKPSPRNPQK